MAIPLVLLFCFCTLAMAASMFYFRKESKSQGMNNIQFIQANFLAQSAIQHILAKISAFPQETRDVGVLSLGHCPFQSILSDAGTVKLGPNTSEGITGLQQFKADCNTASLPFQITGTDFKAANWKYHIEEFKIISAYTIKAEHKLILTARITAIGEVNEEKGGLGWRKEKMIKTIQLTRKN